jgi:hypothetical protein
VSRLNGGLNVPLEDVRFFCYAILWSLALEIKVIEFKVSRVHTAVITPCCDVHRNWQQILP